MCQWPATIAQPLNLFSFLFSTFLLPVLPIRPFFGTALSEILLNSASFRLHQSPMFFVVFDTFFVPGSVKVVEITIFPKHCCIFVHGFWVCSFVF